MSKHGAVAKQEENEDSDYEDLLIALRNLTLGKEETALQTFRQKPRLFNKEFPRFKITPLMACSAEENHCCSLETFSVILDNTRLFNKKYDNGVAVIHVLSRLNRHEHLALMLEKKKDLNVNVVQDREGSTPVNIACEHGALEVLQVLIAKDANIHTPNKEGATPLHSAVRNGHVNCVKLLLANGAKVNARDKKGLTPFDYLAMSDKPSIEISRLLIVHGANVDVFKNKNLATIYHQGKSGLSLFDLCTDVILKQFEQQKMILKSRLPTEIFEHIEKVNRYKS